MSFFQAKYLRKASSPIVNGKRLYSGLSGITPVKNPTLCRNCLDPNCLIKNVYLTKWFATKPKVLTDECDHGHNGSSHNQALERPRLKRKQLNIRVPKNIRSKITQPQLLYVDKQENDIIPNSATDKDSTFDDDLFLYIKKSSVTVDINKSSSKPIEVNVKDRDETLEINLDYVEELEMDNTNPAQNIESITEVLWRETKLDYNKLPEYYMKLSKIRLTGLVVITTMAGYAMAPDPFMLSTFLMCTAGTALTSCSANSINQFFEVPFDAQMNRTKNRVLVRGHLSPLHAATFSVITGTMGVGILAAGVNPVTAALGAFNLGLYTMVYTPMKRYSIANTWVGSVVGAIPPMMGWAACTGGLEPGAWLLAAILYAWQFPHFNSLSWNLRPDYSRGGYRMSSVVRPDMCKRVALRHSIGMIGLCGVAPLVDLTTWTFVAYSLPLNVYMSYLAWNFYRKGDSNSSRKLFRFTLAHIPILMVLMIACKKRGENKPEQLQSTNPQSALVPSL
ncbi:COX10-like protein [Mya arenaria]|uniref:Protoheme IX farnesyltransferase, mitochondrial n=1 Tax=Mya arenaria TaxID=6604 RepID=A0ABY7DH50_MYAAR|nr:protoheme IX farnesyltransferase, mitochondrial-like [Mya arenaria]WAQ97019.1 COX10-like protein [Mya arenaria]